MPLSYTIDNNRDVILTVASGILTDDELLEHKRKLRIDPLLKTGMVELTDLRKITELAVTPEGIKRFVAQDQQDAELFKGYKLAIVVNQDFAFGMGRMYEMMTAANLPDVRIFRDMNEARLWLALPLEN